MDVAQKLLDDLPGQLADLPGPAVPWFTSSADKAALTSVMMAATAAFIADRGHSAEAFSWVRNIRDDIDKDRDGTTLDA